MGTAASYPCVTDCDAMEWMFHYIASVTPGLTEFADRLSCAGLFWRKKALRPRIHLHRQLVAEKG